MEPPLFVNLASECENPEVMEISSICMLCFKEGTTRLLLTKIPHFKNVIVTSFVCPHCGNKNTCIQSSEIQDCGTFYELKILKSSDLGRQIVTSDHAVISIPEVELEIPSVDQKGEITTVEGIIQRVIDNLTLNQETRKFENPDFAQQIELFVEKLKKLLETTEPFSLLLDDVSGNSFIESRSILGEDSQLACKKYKRNSDQNKSIGIFEDNSEETDNDSSKNIGETEELNAQDEVASFSTLCAKCSTPVQTNMKVTPIPHFEEVVIMATNCENCGYRTSEVKSGSGISDKGQCISLHITKPLDLVRDVLKSDTCSVNIPAFDLFVGAGIFGGKFTTVEGLLVDIKEDLVNNSFLVGDSSTNENKATTLKLIENIEKVLSGSLETVLEMDDPAGNSYVQNICEPEPDTNLTIRLYERTFEQNDDLGLNDMKTEGYANTS